MLSLWWLVFVCVAHAIAIASFLHSLHFKLVSHRFWKDDLFYVVAVVFNIVVFGSLFLTHIHASPQEPVPRIAYIVSLDAYFIVIWFMRAGVLMSFIRVLLSVTDGAQAEIALTFIFAFAGVAFSVGATITCVLTSRVHGQVQQLPLPFIVVAASCDILADTYVAGLVYMIIMATPLRPLSKKFILAGFYGPLSVMIVTSTSWILLLTIFSSNIRTQICMLNISTCYSVAMSNMPTIMRRIYSYKFSETSETSLEMHTPIQFRPPSNSNEYAFNHQDEHDGPLLEDVLSTQAVENHIVQDRYSSLSSLTSLGAITDDSDSDSKSGSRSLPLYTS